MTLCRRIGAGSHRRHQRVARFVVSRVALLLVRKNHGLALDAHQDFVLGHFEVGHDDELAALARGPQRGLVHQVGEIGAGKAGSAASDDGKIDIFRQRNLARVHAENFFAALDVRTRHDDAAIEAAGAKQRRIENIRPVGRGDQDHAFVGFKAVHFDEQGVQGLLALVMTPAQVRRRDGGRPRQFHR